MSPPLVLVFDDDLIQHSDFLEGLPARFVFRAHADDCVADIAAVAPDLVLMDFSMQARLNGREALLALRHHHPLGTLRVVAISSDSRMNRLMLEAGADDAIVKMALPERFRELLALLPTLDTP
jgi:CheY-like chemotaxis protein